MFSIKRNRINYFVSGVIVTLITFANVTSTVAQDITDKDSDDKDVTHKDSIDKDSADQNTKPKISEEKIKKDKSKEQQSDDEKKTGASQPSKSPNVFVPSEEISKDLSVSFPVDI